MDVYDKIMLRKRSIIETINDMLKNVAQIVLTRHRSVSNFIVSLLAGMAAYTFYDTKPSINMEFEMEGEGEAAHTFLKQTYMKQWNFDLKLGRKKIVVCYNLSKKEVTLNRIGVNKPEVSTSSFRRSSTMAIREHLGNIKPTDL